MVLVASQASAIESLSMLEIRKAYLAVPVEYQGSPVRALRQGGDESLNRIFLQSVVGMSQKSYQRRLLSMALKFGNPRPVVQPDLDTLVSALTGSPTAIAYMWRRDAQSRTEVKIIKVLWRDQ